ncbi:MAG: helix-turn-helix domain-containing protein [Bacteroidota bacterium]
MKDFQHPFLESICSLENKVDQLIKEYKVRRIKDPDFVILDNSDFMEMFGISTRTAQNWRDEGLIDYAQVKGKIFYKLKDVQNFLERHKKK